MRKNKERKEKKRKGKKRRVRKEELLNLSVIDRAVQTSHKSCEGLACLSVTLLLQGTPANQPPRRGGPADKGGT
jgi:hypothetical protein